MDVWKHLEEVAVEVMTRLFMYYTMIVGKSSERTFVSSIIIACQGRDLLMQNLLAGCDGEGQRELQRQELWLRMRKSGVLEIYIGVTLDMSTGHVH